MDEYMKSDAKAILYDSYLEIVTLSNKVAEATEISNEHRKVLEKLSADIEHLTRSLEAFNLRTSEVKETLVYEIAKEATEMIEQYLKKIHTELHKYQPQKPKKKWWIF